LEDYIQKILKHWDESIEAFEAKIKVEDRTVGIVGYLIVTCLMGNHAPKLVAMVK